MPIGQMSKEKRERGLTKDQLNPGTKEDNEKFGETVYRSGGIHRGPKGKSFEFKAASSKEELKQLLDSGWHKTLEEALFPKTKKKQAAVKPHGNDFTSEDIYNLYKEGKTNAEITEMTGNKSPWLKAKNYAQSNILPWPFEG